MHVYSRIATITQHHIQIADAIADIACWLSLAACEEGSEILAPGCLEYWPELLQALWAEASSPNVASRVCALRVLRDVPSLFGHQAGDYVSSLHQLLAAALDASQGPPQLVSVAAGAVAAFIQDMPEFRHREAFADLIPVMLVDVQTFLLAGDDQVWPCAVLIGGTIIQ